MHLVVVAFAKSGFPWHVWLFHHLFAFRNDQTDEECISLMGDPNDNSSLKYQN